MIVRFGVFEIRCGQIHLVKVAAKDAFNNFEFFRELSEKWITFKFSNFLSA